MVCDAAQQHCRNAHALTIMARRISTMDAEPCAASSSQARQVNLDLGIAGSADEVERRKVEDFGAVGNDAPPDGAADDDRLICLLRRRQWPAQRLWLPLLAQVLDLLRSQHQIVKAQNSGDPQVPPVTT